MQETFNGGKSEKTHKIVADDETWVFHYDRNPEEKTVPCGMLSRGENNSG